MHITPKQKHLGTSNRPCQRTRRTFTECLSRLVGHTVANDAANQILRRGAFITFQEFLLIEQIVRGDRRRHRKRMRRMKLAWDGTEGLYGGWAMQPTELTFKNKLSRLQSDWHGRSCTRKIKEQAPQKNEADEKGRGLHWRPG